MFVTIELPRSPLLAASLSHLLFPPPYHSQYFLVQVYLRIYMYVFLSLLYQSIYQSIYLHWHIFFLYFSLGI